MGERREENLKISKIVIFQSSAALFSAIWVTPAAEYTSQTIAILYLLHFISYQ